MPGAMPSTTSSPGAETMPEPTKKAATGKGEIFPFIPAAWDDYGFTPPQFRVLGHVSRRGICDESVPKMAMRCRLSKKTVEAVISFLCARGIIKKTLRHGYTSVLEVIPISKWPEPTPIKYPPQKKGRPIVWGGTPPKQIPDHPPQSNTHKGTPPEGTPFKEDLAPDAPQPKQSNRIAESGRAGFDLKSLVGGLVGKVSVRIASAPTVEEVRSEMEKQFKGAGQFAESFHRTKTKDGWRDQAGRPINHWQPMARSWASGCERRKRGVSNRR